MDQEEITQINKQENSNIQIAQTNNQTVQFEVQNSEQLNLENQQNPQEVQEANQQDSDQSEWSSSDESEDEQDNQEEKPQEMQTEQEQNNGEDGNKNNKQQKKNKKQTKRFEEDFLEEEDNIIDPKGETMKTKNEQKPQKYEKTESDIERFVRYGVQFKGNETLVEIGQIMTIVDDKIVIATNNGAKEADQRLIVDLDNLIFDENKNIIGTVEDVFGNIKNPFYCIIIDKYTEDMISQKKIETGQKVYMIEGYNKILMKAQLEFLLRQKGCDASNRFDEEVVNDNEIEYSDDEIESKCKNKKAGKERKQDLEDIEDELRDDEGLNPPKAKKNKKIMVMKNENGVLKRLFLKPSEVENLKNNPNNKIQQLPAGMNPNKPQKQNNQQNFTIPTGQNPYYQKQPYQQDRQFRNNNNGNYQNQKNYQQQNHQQQQNYQQQNYDQQNYQQQGYQQNNYYPNQQNYNGQQYNQNYPQQNQFQSPYQHTQQNSYKYGYQNGNNYQQNNQIPQQNYQQSNGYDNNAQKQNYPQNQYNNNQNYQN